MVGEAVLDFGPEVDEFGLGALGDADLLGI